MKLICFITRLSRENIDIEAMYRSISDQFEDFYWLIYIEKDTINTPEKLIQIVEKDSRVIIDNSVKRFDDNDIYFSNAIDYAFNSQHAKQSKWLYVLDDDNIVHSNLSKVLEKINDCDLIINKLYDKRGVHFIDNPQNLSVNICVGYVDFANAVFSSKFFQDKINHLAIYDRSSDGELIRLFLKNNANVVYSNEIAGYYNFLK